MRSVDLKQTGTTANLGFGAVFLTGVGSFLLLLLFPRLSTFSAIQATVIASVAATQELTSSVLVMPLTALPFLGSRLRRVNVSFSLKVLALLSWYGGSMHAFGNSFTYLWVGAICYGTGSATLKPVIRAYSQEAARNFQSKELWFFQIWGVMSNLSFIIAAAISALHREAVSDYFFIGMIANECLILIVTTIGLRQIGGSSSAAERSRFSILDMFPRRTDFNRVEWAGLARMTANMVFASAVFTILVFYGRFNKTVGDAVSWLMIGDAIVSVLFQAAITKAPENIIVRILTSSITVTILTFASFVLLLGNSVISVLFSLLALSVSQTIIAPLLSAIPLGRDRGTTRQVSIFAFASTVGAAGTAAGRVLCGFALDHVKSGFTVPACVGAFILLLTLTWICRGLFLYRRYDAAN
ncbi:hypothetical protein [Burkholderia glumae]